MAIFGSNSNNSSGTGATVFSKPVDPGWAHNSKGGFHSFLEIDPEELNLSGASGVYLIWHAGVRPEWVYVDESNDLASDFHDAGTNTEITHFEGNGGLFVSWAPVRPEYRKGVVKYIETNFITLVKSACAYTNETKSVPVSPPLTSPKRQGLNPLGKL